MLLALELGEIRLLKDTLVLPVLGHSDEGDVVLLVSLRVDAAWLESDALSNTVLDRLLHVHQVAVFRSGLLEQVSLRYRSLLYDP